MNSRKVAYILMTLSFILIVSGGVSSFIIGLKADRDETYKRIDIVNDEFEIFSTNTSVFEMSRDELYNDVLSSVFYDTMYDNDKMVKNRLSNYEKLVDELEENAKALDNLCSDIYYPDSAVNSKCVNYKSIYEQVVNYFVSDINLYNSNIDKFNDYQKANQSSLVLEKYETKKKYIDYNGDKVKDGMEKE